MKNHDCVSKLSIRFCQGSWLLTLKNGLDAWQMFGVVSNNFPHLSKYQCLFDLKLPHACRQTNDKIESKIIMK